MRRFIVPAIAIAVMALIPSTASAWQGPEPVCVPDQFGGYTQVTMTEDEFAHAPGGSLYPVPEGGCIPGTSPPEEKVKVCRNGQEQTVPKSEVLPTDRLGECAPPPKPPAPPSPPAPPATTVVCRNGEMVTIPESEKLPTDTPGCKVVDEPSDHPKVYLGPPIQVAGKEQGNPTPPSNHPIVNARAGESLPFTGSSLWRSVALGLLLVLGGTALRVLPTMVARKHGRG